MRLLSQFKKVTSLFAAATVIYAVRTRSSHGRFLRVPFEFRVPTPDLLRMQGLRLSSVNRGTLHARAGGSNVNRNVGSWESRGSDRLPALGD